ncbi:hypothetical protein D3C78_1435970 [compost metagenome]
MVVGDLGQGIEAIDGRDDLTTHVLEQRFGGATDRLRIVDHHDLQGAGVLFHKMLYRRLCETNCPFAG